MTCSVGAGVHAVMGTGGAPEGVITAAALRCLNGEMLARSATSGLHLADEMKARILNTFLTLMNLRENLDRAALRQPIGRTGG